MVRKFLLRPALVRAASAALLLSACASDPKSAAPPPPSQAAIGFHSLATGLTAAQVRALLGESDKKKPFKAAGITGEIWTYSLRTTTEVRNLSVALQDVPAVNPLTGQPFMRKEPVYQDQSFEVTDYLHLLMINDRLAEWTTTREETRHFQ